MARLIVKSPYIKGGGGGSDPGGYLKYIGTREGVELLPSGYMEYMAERPRSHGLFGDEDNVDMDANTPATSGHTSSPSSGRTLNGWDTTTPLSGEI